MSNEPLTSEKRLCTKPVSDHTGFHFSSCGRPAKYAITKVSGVTVYRCGIHAKRYQKMMEAGHSVESVEVIV